MRVLHVVYSCVPERFRGGVPKAAFELASAQARLGCEVEVFTTTANSSEDTAYRDGDRRNVEGVSIRYFSVSNRRYFASPTLRRALLDAAGEADVLHSHNTFLALNRYVVEGSRHHATPAFFHVHGALDPLVVNRGVIKRARKHLYIRLIERSNLNSAAGIFALSEQEREQVRRWGVDVPTHVVPNGVRPVRHNPAEGSLFRDAWRLPHHSPVVGYLGRIVPKKGLHLLIPAVARVAKQQDLRLVIAGDRRQDPEYVRTLDKLISEHDLVSRVVWTGFLDERSKVGLLSAADIFSHVTESEGMALAVLEAMAAGVPTIVSDTCYMYEAAQTGAVVEVSYDVGCIADALLRLLEDRVQRSVVGRRGADYTAEVHSWDKIAARALQYYSMTVA